MIVIAIRIFIIFTSRKLETENREKKTANRKPGTESLGTENWEATENLEPTAPRGEPESRKSDPGASRKPGGTGVYLRQEAYKLCLPEEK